MQVEAKAMASTHVFAKWGGGVKATTPTPGLVSGRVTAQKAKNQDSWKVFQCLSLFLFFCRGHRMDVVG